MKLDLTVSEAELLEEILRCYETQCLHKVEMAKKEKNRKHTQTWRAKRKIAVSLLIKIHYGGIEQLSAEQE